MKIVTFGEIMMRLSPHNYLRFNQANEFEINYGGGEANVAVSLANYGLKPYFVTKLPYNEIGYSARNILRGLGVNTDNISYGGDRLGIYYIEKGASQRSSNVIYDRKYSSIYESTSEDFDWNKIFKDADWFHFTGITPAISNNVFQVTKEACKVAKKKGITVSCDLNYRKKMWSTEEANKTMTELAPYIDVLISNEEDSEKVFGITPENTDVDKGILNHKGYEDVAKQLIKRFDFDYVAITLRESINANFNKWGAMLYHDKKAYYSKIYDLNIVDRVGGGDSFAGALIYSLISEYDEQDAVDFSVAASCLKHSIEGDFNRVNESEVKELVKGKNSGRVER